MSDEIREVLADYAHEAWSGWMEYLFSKSMLNLDGSITIPGAYYTNLCRLMNTPDLSKDEKQSDREEARKMIDIFLQYQAASSLPSSCLLRSEPPRPRGAIRESPGAPPWRGGGLTASFAISSIRCLRRLRTRRRRDGSVQTESGG